MHTTETTDQETVHLQESGSQGLEDTRRPAAEILAEQSAEEMQPSLFIP